MSIKPSPAQQRILDALAAGGRITQRPGHVRYEINGQFIQNGATLRRMVDLGWLDADFKLRGAGLRLATQPPVHLSIGEMGRAIFADDSIGSLKPWQVDRVLLALRKVVAINQRAGRSTRMGGDESYLQLEYHTCV